MLTYKAMYKFVEGGVHAEVLDFPGVITCAENLPEAKRLLASKPTRSPGLILRSRHLRPLSVM